MAFAQSLKANLKSGQSLLKQIAATMNDTARIQNPDSGSLKNYQELMDQSIVLMRSLESAFKANDNVLVLSLMQKLNTTKKEGDDL